MKTQIKLPQNCHVVTALSFFSTFFTDFVLPHWRELLWERMMYDEGEGGMGKICFMSKKKKCIKKLFTLTLTGQ